ncbi:hypothetical protein [Flammeovirga aprica]|uniref:Uncharacterized protein n=1 Tax=Flammeovirga aprica JL-4 TaxID=694437 RepID=A0A7X9NZ04_9BACT|nr:hypothetical protein [Flammeovirga aprica]NME66531.1 hypothetical protein [Flammeovirga aprica JL-4]
MRNSTSEKERRETIRRKREELMPGLSGVQEKGSYIMMIGKIAIPIIAIAIAFSNGSSLNIIDYITYKISTNISPESEEDYIARLQEFFPENLGKYGETFYCNGDILMLEYNLVAGTYVRAKQYHLRPITRNTDDYRIEYEGVFTTDGEFIIEYQNGYYVSKEAGPISYDIIEHDSSFMFLKNNWYSHVNEISISNPDTLFFYSEDLEHPYLGDIYGKPVIIDLDKIVDYYFGADVHQAMKNSEYKYHLSDFRFEDLQILGDPGIHREASEVEFIAKDANDQHYKINIHRNGRVKREKTQAPKSL